MNKSEIFFKFQKALFWDVDIDALDLEAHAKFIIERVVSMGSLPDWELIKEIYGRERIKNETLTIRYLDKKTVSFLSAYFNVEKTDYRCCN